MLFLCVCIKFNYVFKHVEVDDYTRRAETKDLNMPDDNIDLLINAIQNPVSKFLLQTYFWTILMMQYHVICLDKV